MDNITLNLRVLHGLSASDLQAGTGEIEKGQGGRFRSDVELGTHFPQFHVERRGRVYPGRVLGSDKQLCAQGRITESQAWVRLGILVPGAFSDVPHPFLVFLVELGKNTKEHCLSLNWHGC